MKPQVVDAWKWRVIQADTGLDVVPTVVAEGECDNYEAAQAAMYLAGVRRVPTYDNRLVAGSRLCFRFGKQRVYIEYTRLRDGYRMTDWGSTSDVELVKRLL